MKISVLGAGAMGSLFGGLLAESGQDVTLLDVNDAHVAAVRGAGLRLETDGRDRRITAIRASRPEEAAAAPDLLVVFTKTTHTAEAMKLAGGAIGDRTLILSLQNGLGNVEKLAAHVPRERILIGVTTWPADFVAPGHVRSHGAGRIRAMSADPSASARMQEVAEILNGAGLHCSPDPTVWTAIWEKVAFNAALNGICAVAHCTVDEVGATAGGTDLAERLVGEVLAVARAEGVAVDEEQCLRTLRHAIAHHRGHRPSMLQDILAGRPTEVASIHGAVVERARTHGIAVPHVETLFELIRLTDRAGTTD